MVVACDVVDNESLSTFKDDGADLMSDKFDNGRRRIIFSLEKKILRHMLHVSSLSQEPRG